MASPVPGMNPYLEAIWHDFHERFLPAAAAYLVPQIRPKYFVSIYRSDPEPPLTRDDAIWAHAFVPRPGPNEESR
jgi:uncharacterized protein DUF4058